MGPDDKEVRGHGVPWPASEPRAFDKRVQAPVNFTQTAFDRSLVIFGELSHKFVPSCCRNLLSVGRGRKRRLAGRSSQKAGIEAGSGQSWEASHRSGALCRAQLLKMGAAPTH